MKTDVKYHKGILVSVVHVINLVNHSRHFQEVTWSLVDVVELSVSAAATLTVFIARHVTTNPRQGGEGDFLIDITMVQ